MKIKSFTDLKAWQEAHSLVLEIYKITAKFPSEERFGLVNQIRRAIISVTSNISEGFSRNGAKEKSQFYRMALGSLLEVQNQLIIARDLNYITIVEYSNLFNRSIVVSKLINGLIKSASDRI